MRQLPLVFLFSGIHKYRFSLKPRNDRRRLPPAAFASSQQSAFSLKARVLCPYIPAFFLSAPKGHAAMVMAMEDAADEETAKRLRKVDFLNVLGQLAPMAGLFGTVYGMILAFQSIVAAGGNADPVLLAGGIGTALVTTFWGLVVAIPALMGYAVIRNRILNASEAVVAEVTALIRPFDPALRKPSPPADRRGMPPHLPTTTTRAVWRK